MVANIPSLLERLLILSSNNVITWLNPSPLKQMGGAEYHRSQYPQTHYRFYIFSTSISELPWKTPVP